MDNERKRPYQERACKTRMYSNAIDPLYLNPKLWRKLPPEVAYMVLSFLPVDRLMDTLQRVNRKWEKLLRCDAFAQLFGHGDNLNSSYGIVTLADRKVARLMAFEHESQEWRKFPKKLHPEMKKVKLLSGSRDGLMLCESKKCRFTSLEHSKHYPDVGVWNPLLRSLKWLPRNPHLISECIPYDCRIHYTVMVNEPSRTYQVFFMHYSHRTRKILYSVYSSTTGSWRRSKSVPDFFPRASGFWKGIASCDRYIFLHSFETRRPSTLDRRAFFTREYFIYWYDAEMDRWDRVFVSQILQDLGYRAKNLKYPAMVENFVILHGVLYMLIRMVHINEERGDGVVECQYTYPLASVDLSALGGELGAASLTFKLEAVVPDGFRVPTSGDGISGAKFNFYCYTMKGKGYIGVRTSESGRFLYFDVSKGDWLEYDKYPEVGVRNWETGKFCFQFKPSLVVP